MGESRDIIAFQGVAGAHSDMACQIAYPYHTTLPCHTFEDVFTAVEEGKAALGLIPIENSYAGRVAEIHQLLPHTNLHVVGEYFHPVRHHLMAPKGAKIAGLEAVYSHQQALMQCQKKLIAMGVKRELFSDTAAAAQKVAEEGNPAHGAVASTLAAELYGLEILEEDIQDADDNRTLFLAFSKEPYDITGREETILTSLIFTTRNIPAGLYKALGGFATNNVNLLKLESYIPDYHAGTAQFFITLEGNPEQPHVQRALEELGFFTASQHWLGVYPASDFRR